MALAGLWLTAALPARCAVVTAAEEAEESAAAREVQAATAALVQDFNAGKPAAIVANFLPQGELIDEAGVVHQGREALEQLFTRYFDKFPGAKLEVEVASVRLIGDRLAIQEGTRTLSMSDGTQARVRFSTVLAKTEGGWRIASTRETFDEPAPTPSAQLAPLAWLVGDWLGEGTDSAVSLSFRWDEGQSFLLGDYVSTKNGQPWMRSTQRIGWDPLAGQIRSWLFDSDGGFAEGRWTATENAWVIRSSATTPEGVAGSATLTIVPEGTNRFLLQGTDRVVGDHREDDFELTLSRAPPSANAKATETPRGTQRRAPLEKPAPAAK